MTGVEALFLLAAPCGAGRPFGSSGNPSCSGPPLGVHRPAIGHILHTWPESIGSSGLYGTATADIEWPKAIWLSPVRSFSLAAGVFTAM